MNIQRIDLNLLVYFDVLLRECSVTKAANRLGITQPAMSNGLKRLRVLFGDPLLVRTSEGMTPTDRAKELKPMVRNAVAAAELAIQPIKAFNEIDSDRVFRIMANDYAESTLIPKLLKRLNETAPGVRIDVMTPSDVSFLDVELGKVDLAINRFDTMPQSFHQITLWKDDFTCLMRKDNAIFEGNDFTLDAYLSGRHVWVSKSGMGVGVGITPEDVQHLGWVDEALGLTGNQRQIAVFTRHYQTAVHLAQDVDLIVTIPTKLAHLFENSSQFISYPPPFEIPAFELKMAWSPLLHHSADHRWIRGLLLECAQPEEIRK
jgi:DNA-binding transcriptional LysR family regulator